jgi:ABC-2 type transport system ATP-binding protein
MTVAITEAVITVKNLKKSYNGIPVLKGVDFYVKPGRIFALLGSNGAGKTTTVKILTTLLSFDEGEITINNCDIKKQAKKVREVISLTGQYAAVDEAQTGRENLVMMAKLRHTPLKLAGIDKLLQQFSLTEAADKRVSAYSGGMRRKLDLAMSLIGDPQIIYLDEPTTGLDPQSRIAMWDIVQELSSAGKTIFLTTQYLEEAERLADYIAILHEGKIIAEGNFAELRQKFPPAKKEYIEKQPSLEDIFLAIIGGE